MSVVEFRPNPSLLRAVREALAVCAVHWPKLKLAADASEAADVLVAGYARACGSSDHELIIEAAHRWAAEHDFAPKPVELGRLARQLTAQRRGDPDVVVAAPVQAPAPDKDLTRIDELGRWALKRITQAQLASVWALLWQTAPTDADRIAVRCGTLNREVFRDAVATIQRQAAA